MIGMRRCAAALTGAATVAATAALATAVVSATRASATAGGAPPTSLVLSTTLRDFLYYGTTSPGFGDPDFQNKAAGLETGLVQSTLGTDSEPVWKSNGQTLSGAANFCWWYHDRGCNGAGSVNPYAADVPDDASGNPPSITLTQISQGVYQYANTAYYPVDGLGWNSPQHGSPQTSADCNSNVQHNFAFTQEIHSAFVYSPSLSPTVTLTTEDDGWLFINGKLAIDLGGVHSASTGSITLNPSTAATFGLTNGQLVSFDLFTAQRHTCASQLSLTTSLLLAQPADVEVGGVTEGAHYPYGDVPAATCSVSSDIDGTPTVQPVLSTPSNGDGTGQQTATCTYTDRAGETSSASVTYTIEASRDQSVSFTSVPPTHALVGTAYTVTATGGPSGRPVVFITDPSSHGCGVDADGTVTFTAPGSCRIDAGQAEGSGFTAAQSVQQRIQVYKTPQLVAFTSVPPDHSLVGTPYTAEASGGDSGNPVVFSTSASSAGICTVTSDGAVTFEAPGRCVVLAEQAGNAFYQPGSATQPIAVYRR
jgi:fibro-slime domain-containing protein